MLHTVLGGRYEIQGEVGRGGMGVVYRAHDSLLGRTVAVKVLPPELRTGELPSRFLQEARVMAQLAHPNIIAVYDVGEAEGAPYFVMELVTGERLAASMARLSLRERLDIAAQVCRALAHAHAHGVVHRDVKPENILLTPDRTVKLSDFGLARVLGGERVSRSGVMLGTFSSMAPEQVLGGEVDGRADLYAVGVLLYEFATGRLPFTGEDAVAVISQHLRVAPVAPHLLNPEVDPALERVLLKLLQKDPEDRYQSALDLERALEGVRAGLEAPGTDAGRPVGSVITMLFVDLVNSTALKAALPGSDLMARNRAYFDTILTPHRRRVEADLARFGGRVVKTAGDDHFLVFPNAAQAAQWAVSLQIAHADEPIATPLGPLQVRIGMHTGAPMADPGDPQDYLGHEVDTAKRVSALASGGQILLSETTAALVRDARIAGLALHAHGAREMKGIGRVPLFELLHGDQRPRPLQRGMVDGQWLMVDGNEADRQPSTIDHQPSGRLPISTPALLNALARGRMVGRDVELAELKRQVEAAQEGAGATLFLAGEPGIGKTRLATEVGIYARLRGFRVLAGRCDEQGAAPYQPLVEALREYLETTESWQVEQAMPTPVACELVRIVPQIASKVKDVPSVPPLPAEQARQALTDALRQFFAFVTTHDAPVLLFLDDLHWADEGSLALMHALARQAKSARLLILGTYRDVELDTQHPLERTLAALNRERLSQRISLRRLPEPAVAEMVAAILDEPPSQFRIGSYPLPASRAPVSQIDADRKDSVPNHLRQSAKRVPAKRAEDNSRSEIGPPAAFLATLHHETEGNPFFIEEVLKHLVEEGAIYREGGRWQIQLPEHVSIPQSIKVTIGRRLQRLSEESREALTLAAVIGQQFSFEALLKASEMKEERLLDITEEWLDAHLVVEQRVGRQEVYRFQHAQIRQVPYEALSLRRKARLHERVGLALEAAYAGSLEERLDELAYHFAQAHGEATVEKGVDYCLRAGEKACNLDANEEAIRHLTAALELLDGLPEDEPHLQKRWQVVSNLARAYMACQASERGRDVLQEYLALAQRVGYPWGMAAAHYWMGQGFSPLSPVREEHREKSLQIAEQHGLTDWRARARNELAVEISGRSSDLPRAEALLRATLQDPEGVIKEDVQATYREILHVLALQGKWDEVAALLRQSISFGGPGGYPTWLSAMEEALDKAGKQVQFLAFCEEAKVLYAQAGLPLTPNPWYLQPTTPSEGFRQLLFRDELDAPEIRPEWQWHDPIQASAYSLSDRPGFLTLRAAPGVDLYPPNNLNAPRILLEVRGDFALEAKMEGDWDERTDSGSSSGLLVWKDVLNYVRLEKFALNRFHHGHIALMARIRGEYRNVGRGLLRGDAFHLRLERTGDRFATLCSTDGIHWLSCGQVVLPVKDPLLVGVSALKGMVVHFDWVQVQGREDLPPR